MDRGNNFPTPPKDSPIMRDQPGLSTQRSRLRSLATSLGMDPEKLWPNLDTMTQGELFDAIKALREEAN